MSASKAAAPWRIPRLPAALVPIYGTTLADLFGYTLMIPLLPALAELYGASALTVGALLSVPAFCSMITAPLWGKLSDRLGRKTVLLISQCFSLAGYLLLAFSHSLVWIFISRIISGSGAGNVSAAQSYIADVTEPDERSAAFAIYGVIFGAGFVIGPVASSFLMRHGIAIPFVLAASLSVLNLVLTALFLPKYTRSKRPRTSFRASLRVLKRPTIRRLFVRQFLFIFGVVYFLGSFALFLQRDLHSDVSRVMWLLAVAGLIGGAVQGIFVAPLTAYIGGRNVAQIGLGFLAFAYAALFFVTNIDLFVVVLVLWAIGAALFAPTMMVLLAARTPQEERGAIMGLGDSINSVAFILAPLVGSAVVGADPRFLGVLPMSAMLVALWFGVRRRIR